jgi:hypothetical protein
VIGTCLGLPGREDAVTPRGRLRRMPDAPCGLRCSSAHQSLLPPRRTVAPPGGRTATRLLCAGQSRPPCLHPLPPVSQACLSRYQSPRLCPSVQDVAPTSVLGHLHARGRAPVGPCQPRPRQKTKTAIMVATPSSTATVRVGSDNSKHPGPITRPS